MNLNTKKHFFTILGHFFQFSNICYHGCDKFFSWSVGSVSNYENFPFALELLLVIQVPHSTETQMTHHCARLCLVRYIEFKVAWICRMFIAKIHIYLNMNFYKIYHFWLLHLYISLTILVRPWIEVGMHKCRDREH